MQLIVLFCGMTAQLALRLVLVGGPVWLLLRHLLRKTKAPVWLPVLLAVLLTECAFGLLRYHPILLCPEEDRAVFSRVLDTMLDNLGGRGLSPNQVFGALAEADKRKEKK